MLTNSYIRGILEAFGDDPADFEAGGAAQELKVPFNAGEDSTVPPTDNVDSAVAAGIGKQAPTTNPSGGAGGVAPLTQAPGNISQSITIDKTLVNTDLIHAILGEIKALVTNAERIFDKEDLESADAQIYIGNLVNSINGSTEKLVAFLEAPEETPGVE